MTLPSIKSGNEKGSTAVIALMILTIVTILGMSALETETIEVQIAANYRDHKTAFYAADAAMGYVEKNPRYYGSNNIVVGGNKCYPNSGDAGEILTLNANQRFKGAVEYEGSMTPPRGSGFQVGRFMAHRYSASSTGYGPANSESRIEVGFYRIGF